LLPCKRGNSRTPVSASVISSLSQRIRVTFSDLVHSRLGMADLTELFDSSVAMTLRKRWEQRARVKLAFAQ